MPHPTSIAAIKDGRLVSGFTHDLLQLPVQAIMLVKPVSEAMRTGAKYQQILSSIREVGIIEPPVVTAEGIKSQQYILLDGHLRLAALKELGIPTIHCLLSTDDESFTYNKHVNRISPIQEHRMIRRAIERGVSEEKIAKALNLDVKSIMIKHNLLDGICQEATDILKDKMVATGVFPILKRMKAYRQVEAVMLMQDAGNYSKTYAQALFAATPQEQLANPNKPKSVKGITEEQMARMESEMLSLQREYRLIEENYGADVLNLTLAKGYLTSLLGNAKIVRFLAQHHTEMLREFQKITEMTSLNTMDA